MLRSVRGWLLKICHTEGPHTLGKMVSHTEDQHFHQGIPIFLWLWSSIVTVPMKLSPHEAVPTVPMKLSAIQGVSFSQRDPGKMGIPGPHFRGTAWYGNWRSPFLGCSHFHMTMELNMRAKNCSVFPPPGIQYLIQIYWLLSTLLIPCILLVFWAQFPSISARLYE